MNTIWEDYKTLIDFARFAAVERETVLSYFEDCNYTPKMIWLSMFEEIKRKREVRKNEKKYLSYKRVEI